MQVKAWCCKANKALVVVLSQLLGLVVLLYVYIKYEIHLQEKYSNDICVI